MTCSLTCGVFDCLHEGHVNLLREMRKRSECVVVVLHDDMSTFRNKGRFPVQTLNHRLRNLRASGLTDGVIPTHDIDPSGTINVAINTYRPTVFIRADDWVGFPGKAAVDAAGIPIEYVPYTQGVSTSMIRQCVGVADA